MRLGLLFSLIAFSLQIKSINIDSLQKIINKMPDDSAKVSYLFKLSNDLILSDRPNAEKIINQTLVICKKFHFQEATGRCYIILGNLEKDKNNPIKGLQFDTIAKNIFIEINQAERLAKAYHSIGLDYEMLSDFKNAMKNYQLSISLNRKIGNQESLRITLFNLVSVYVEQGLIKKADSLMQELLKYPNEALNLKQKALIYGNCGVIKSMLGDNKKAIEFFKKSIEVNTQNNDIDAANVSILNLAHSYYNIKQYDTSLTYLAHALEYFEEKKDSFNVFSGYRYASENYTAKKDFNKALYYLNHLEKNFKTIYEKNINEKEHLYENFVTLYNKKEDYKNAFKYSQQLIIIIDSLDFLKYNEQVSQIEGQLAIHQKENTILLLNKDKELLEKTKDSERKSKFLILFSSIGLISIGGILYNRNRVKQKLILQNQKTEMLQIEQKMLRSQMNPHFIFNALGAIQSFIQKKESEEATSYLQKFSRLVRLILENSRLDYVPINKEIKTLQDYLQLQQLLFDNNFDYYIDIDEKIDQENICIPPMLAQPFIENALKHGLANSQKKGLLKISFKLKDQFVLFDVIDNGVGLQKAWELKASADAPHQSLATEITNERLQNLNRSNTKKISIHIKELSGKMNEIIGTKVTFEIPFKYSV